MDTSGRLRGIVIRGLRRKNGGGLIGIVLLQVWLSTGWRLERSGTSALRRCLIASLHMRMLGMLLVLRSVLHHKRWTRYDARMGRTDIWVQGCRRGGSRRPEEVTWWSPQQSRVRKDTGFRRLGWAIKKSNEAYGVMAGLLRRARWGDCALKCCCRGHWTL